MSIEEILKWVDDFVFFRSPCGSSEGRFVYKYDEKVFFELGDELGWIWEPSKHTPFSRWFTHIGFDWDLDEKTVSLPEAKLVKYLEKLDPWREGASVTRKATENIVGYLLFKRSRAGPSATALLVWNYCIKPEVRTHLNGMGLMSAGLIPGPHPPKDMRSFLIPYDEECVQLAVGVRTFNYEGPNAHLIRRNYFRSGATILYGKPLLSECSHQCRADCRTRTPKPAHVNGAAVLMPNSA
jgi:hypothetical protein